MLDSYTIIFAACGALTVALYYATQVPKTSSDASSLDSKRTPEFDTFQRTWLGVYLLAMFSDWLQGPYAYALHSSLGFTSSQIAILSLVGFGSSMIFGTFVGSISDSIGRKKMSLVFVLLYTLAALTKLSSAYSILCIGRVLSGIATSLLFSVFEAWMVCAHNKRKFPAELISDTFSKATAGNGLCAVFAGLVADQLCAYWGFAAPFVFACVPLVILGVIVHLYWDENTGVDSNTPENDPTARKSIIQQLLEIFQTTPHILALGLAQSLFEGAMYTFVFLWSPTLSDVTTLPGKDLPYGRIFATFMVMISFGSYLFGYIVRNFDILIIPFIIHALAGFSMVLASWLAHTNEFIVLAFFLLFEMTCGMFWPTYGTLRSAHIQEAQRATVSTIFRIPLNLFVVVLLFQTDKLSSQTMFIICGCAHFGSLLCYSLFYFKSQQAKSAKTD